MCAFTYNYKPYAWGWDIKLSQQRLWFNLLNKRGPHVDSYFHIEFLVQIVFNGIYQVFKFASTDESFRNTKLLLYLQILKLLPHNKWILVYLLFLSEYWMAESLWIYVLIICWNISVHLFFIFSISSMLTSPWQSNMANFSGKMRFCVLFKHTVLWIEFYLMY